MPAKPRYWTYTGRYAFYTKRGAEQFTAAVENLLEDSDRVQGILQGSGYLVRQPLRSHRHVIEFTPSGWTIEHPIDCEVMACRLTKLARRLKSAPVPVPHGRYWLFLTNGKLDIGNSLM